MRLHTMQHYDRVADMTGEDMKAAKNMAKYGGSFVIALANLMWHADPENLRRIKRTWPEYYKRYREWDKEKV